MKKLLRKPVYLAVLLAVAYCLTLTLGVLIIYSYPIYKQKHYCLYVTQIIAQEYCQGVDDAIDIMFDSDAHILFFDTEGTCVRHIYPTASNDELNIPFEKELAAALAGNEVFHPKFTRDRKVEIVTCVPIRDDDAVVGAVVLARVITDWYGAVRVFAICFTIMYWGVFFSFAWDIHKKKKYEELERNYIANVTHALKAPIASVKALAEALSDVVEPGSDKQRLYHEMILQETNIQSHMVQEILALSKLQDQGMDFSKTEVDASELFAQILEKYAALCDCAGISFHVSEEISRLPQLYTNAACVRQVLEILLENAVKYVDDGGDIWVDVEAAKNQAVFCVKDNGVGISKENLPHIFERFYRCSRQKNKSGSGLGLAIAKETLDGLKEKIWAESELGKGAAFFFTVQLK